MNLEGKGQKPEESGLPLGGKGEAPKPHGSGDAPTAGQGDGRSGTDRLMERVVERDNALAALKRVRRNKGSPGADGMSVDELPKHLREQWKDLREQLLAGTYQPRPVRRHEIPKPGGGTRMLGIPTVLDRFIQQAILQVLQPMFDPGFSEHSYGFRPGRSAHDAVTAAQGYVQEGRRWVVDVDLEAFFDRVNHDVLMGRLAKRIADKRLLKLIRRYLEAGMMADGVVTRRDEGTPQGGPLSPLLANVLLDDVDKELERRGHAFVRYADDCNVYVRSQRAGERVMDGLRQLYAKLRLKVNEAKSAVAHVKDRKFLGFGFYWGTGGVKRRVAPKAMEKMRKRVRDITNRARGVSMAVMAEELGAYLRGWREYFRLAQTPQKFRELDGWIRRRILAARLAQWKHSGAAFRHLRARGVPPIPAREAAINVRRWWRTSASVGVRMAFPADYHHQHLGIPRLAA